MNEGANPLAQFGEFGRGLDLARVAVARKGAHELEVEPSHDPSGPRRHDDEARTEKQRLLDRMGDEEDLLAGARPNVDQKLLHRLARHAVERAERLVHEEDGRVGRERPGDADPLSHAAGELIRGSVGEFAQAHETEQFERPRPPLRTIQGLRAALADRHVLFFENQSLEPKAHRDFASRFGKLHVHPIYAHIEDVPEITLIETRADSTPDNDNWHTDVTFSQTPPFGA